MEIIHYTEEHRMFRDTVRKYLEKEVVPYVEEWEEAGITPKSAWKKLGDQGFLCLAGRIPVPVEVSQESAAFIVAAACQPERQEFGRQVFGGLIATYYQITVLKSHRLCLFPSARSGSCGVIVVTGALAVNLVSARQRLGAYGSTERVEPAIGSV